jgi:hypothetical protein
MKTGRTIVAVAVFFSTQLLAISAGADEPGFVKYFTAAHKQLFALNDPVPQVQKLLESPALRKVLLEGKFAQLIAVHQPGVILDPQIALGFIQQNQRWIPREIALGIDDFSVNFSDVLIRLIILGQVGRGATMLENPARAKEIKQIEAQVLAQVKRMQMPGLRICARMRQAEDAAALVGLAGVGLKDAGLPETLQLKVSETRVSLVATLGDFIPEVTLRQVLESLGVVTAPDSPAAGQMVKIIRAWSVPVSLESDGDMMVLTVGKPPAGAPLKPADLGPVFRWDANDILFTRWDAKLFKQVGAEWNKLWQNLQDTPAGRKAVEIDDTDILGKLASTAEQLASASDSGQSRLWVNKADSSMQAELHEQGFVEAPSLAKSAIVKAIPADAEAFEITSEGSLAGLVAGTLTQLENQFEQQVSRSAVNNAPGMAELRQILRSYQENFREFRSLLMNKALAQFDPGAGWVIGTRGKVSNFELKIDANGEKHSFAGKDLPMMEFALVGKAKDEKKVDQLMADLYAALVKGIRGSAGIQDKAGAAAPPPAVKQVDLGLGRTTWVLDGSFIYDLAKAGGANISLKIEGDLRPHYFQINGLLVFSTSVRLSKQIIDSASGKTTAITLPAVEGNLVSYGRFPGQTLAGYAHHAAAWTKVFVKDDPTGAEVVQALDGVGEVFELIKDSNWKVTQKGNDQVSQSVTTFK